MKQQFSNALRAVLVVAGTFSSLANGEEELPTPQNSYGVNSADSEWGASQAEQIQNEDFSVLMRGPLHEAFAEQYAAEPAPGQVVTKAPPDPVQEIPPEYRPDLEDMVWIPGYWGWEPEEEEFIWVSGIWRQVPEGQQWIPGYWVEVDNGFQWIGGFWSNVEDVEIAYQPMPPTTLEYGPSTPAPDEHHFWTPGCWVYEDTNYVWQPGYWQPSQDNMVWVPARYIWTPSGVIFRPGYWDYAFDARGILFCPVRFVDLTPTYVYRPVYIVQTNPAWFANLFICPQYHHYYYGNYFNRRGRTVFYPWCTYQQTTRRYDPLFSYFAYQSGRNDLLRTVNSLHGHYQRTPQARPAITLAGHHANRFENNGPQSDSLSLNVANIAAVANRGSDFKLPYGVRNLGQRERQTIQDEVKPYRQIAVDRKSIERATEIADRARSNIQNQTRGRSGTQPTANLGATKILKLDAGGPQRTTASPLAARRIELDESTVRRDRSNSVAGLNSRNAEGRREQSSPEQLPNNADLGRLVKPESSALFSERQAGRERPGLGQGSTGQRMNRTTLEKLNGQPQTQQVPSRVGSNIGRRSPSASLGLDNTGSDPRTVPQVDLRSNRVERNDYGQRRDGDRLPLNDQRAVPNTDLSNTRNFAPGNAAKQERGRINSMLNSSSNAARTSTSPPASSSFKPAFPPNITRSNIGERRSQPMFNNVAPGLGRSQVKPPNSDTTFRAGPQQNSNLGIQSQNRMSNRYSSGSSSRRSESRGDRDQSDKGGRGRR